jgi:hypothetical protein
MTIEQPASVGSINIDTHQALQNTLDSLNKLIHEMTENTSEKCCSACNCQ